MWPLNKKQKHLKEFSSTEPAESDWRERMDKYKIVCLSSICFPEVIEQSLFWVVLKGQVQQGSEEWSLSAQDTQGHIYVATRTISPTNNRASLVTQSARTQNEYQDPTSELAHNSARWYVVVPVGMNSFMITQWLMKQWFLNFIT